MNNSKVLATLPPTVVCRQFRWQCGHIKTIIPHTHAIKADAMGYIILIVPSYDPNLD